MFSLATAAQWFAVCSLLRAFGCLGSAFVANVNDFDNHLPKFFAGNDGLVSPHASQELTKLNNAGHWWLHVGDYIYHAPADVASAGSLNHDISNYFFAAGSEAGLTDELSQLRVGGEGRWHIFHIPSGGPGSLKKKPPFGGDRRASLSALTQVLHGVVLPKRFPDYRPSGQYTNPLSIAAQKVEKAVVSSLSETDVTHFLDVLTKVRPTASDPESRSFESLAATVNSEKVLSKEFISMGYKTCLHNFKFGAHKLANVVALAPGRQTKSEPVIVGAHYDSRPYHGLAPGAVDNGSGVAAMMAMAKAFKSANIMPTRNVVFVGFGGEEPGLVGSKAMVAAMKAGSFWKECQVQGGSALFHSAESSDAREHEYEGEFRQRRNVVETPFRVDTQPLRGFNAEASVAEVPRSGHDAESDDDGERSPESEEGPAGCRSSSSMGESAESDSTADDSTNGKMRMAGLAIGAIIMDEVGWQSTSLKKPTINLETYDGIGTAMMQHLVRSSYEYNGNATVDVTHNGHPFGSDHMSFLNAHVPSVLTIMGDDESYPHYHKSSDSPKEFSPSLALSFAKMNLATLLRMSGVENSSSYSSLQEDSDNGGGDHEERKLTGEGRVEAVRDGAKEEISSEEGKADDPQDEEEQQAKDDHQQDDQQGEYDDDETDDSGETEHAEREDGDKADSPEEDIDEGQSDEHGDDDDEGEDDTDEETDDENEEEVDDEDKEGDDVEMDGEDAEAGGEEGDAEEEVDEEDKEGDDVEMDGEDAEAGGEEGDAEEEVDEDGSETVASLVEEDTYE